MNCPVLRLELSPSVAEDRFDNIHHKQQHDRHFQNHHPPIVLIVLAAIWYNVIQRLELLVDRRGASPQMETRD